jgi:hypothetical protein
MMIAIAHAFAFERIAGIRVSAVPRGIFDGLLQNKP